SLAFAACALLRRRQVALGVRQDMPRYIRERHPGNRGLHAVAMALETAWRAAARGSAVVAVGTDLGHRYRRARRLLVSHVSLVSKRDIAPEEVAAARDWTGELRERLVAAGVERVGAHTIESESAAVAAFLQHRGT